MNQVECIIAALIDGGMPEKKIRSILLQAAEEHEAWKNPGPNMGYCVERFAQARQLYRETRWIMGK